MVNMICLTHSMMKWVTDEFLNYMMSLRIFYFTERSDEISDRDKLYDDDYNEGWTVRPGNRQDMRIKR